MVILMEINKDLLINALKGKREPYDDEPHIKAYDYKKAWDYNVLKEMSWEELIELYDKDEEKERKQYWKEYMSKL